MLLTVILHSLLQRNNDALSTLSLAVLFEDRTTSFIMFISIESNAALFH